MIAICYYTCTDWWSRLYQWLSFSFLICSMYVCVPRHAICCLLTAWEQDPLQSGIGVSEARSTSKRAPLYPRGLERSTLGAFRIHSLKEVRNSLSKHSLTHFFKNIEKSQEHAISSHPLLGCMYVYTGQVRGCGAMGHLLLSLISRPLCHIAARPSPSSAWSSSVL